MCLALVILSLENMKLFYKQDVNLVCLNNELLGDSATIKCLIAFKFSENRVETLQIFFFSFCHVFICLFLLLFSFLKKEHSRNH